MKSSAARLRAVPNPPDAGPATDVALEGPGKSTQDHADPEEGALIRRAKQGDIVAFEALYGLHVGRVHALCRRMCRNPSIAEERTQDAFVRAWQKLDSFRGDSAFGSWLHRLTANVVIGAMRADKRYRERVSPFEDPAQEAQARDLGEILHDSAHESPKSLAMDLETAISTLPTGARVVFLLHDVEGWKHREIAEHLGLSTNTSKSQLHRARSLLQSILRTSTGDAPPPKTPNPRRPNPRHSNPRHSNPAPTGNAPDHRGKQNDTF